jgi:hypothetical protein
MRVFIILTANPVLLFVCSQLGAAAEAQELAGAQQYLEEETSYDKWVVL